MENALLTLAVLACPVGMGAMMWLMMRGPTGSNRTTGTHAELAQLRAELDQLKAERQTRTGER